MAHAAKFRDVLIDGCAPLRDALRQLCANSKRALFIAEDDVLKASLCGGDVRQFLLTGGGMMTPFLSEGLLEKVSTTLGLGKRGQPMGIGRRNEYIDGQWF